MIKTPSKIDYMRAYDTLDFLMGAVEAEAYQRARPQTETMELSVLLITGFLGTGKTTLMRRLVAANQGVRLAAIVNDLANLNVDAALVSEAGKGQGIETISLANGCICCSQSGSIARALAKIQGWDTPPERVLIEASGVADPSALTTVVGGMAGIRLEAVIAIVDAAAQGRNEGQKLIDRGVRAADLVLVNKTDLVSPEAAASLERKLITLAPKAAVLRTIDCAIPIGLILDLPSRDKSRPPTNLALEDERFVGIELLQSKPLPRRDIEAMIAKAPAGIFRVKGAVDLSDASKPELLQAVGRRFRWSQISSATSELEGHLVVVTAADAQENTTHFQPTFRQRKRQ